MDNCKNSDCKFAEDCILPESCANYCPEWRVNPAQRPAYSYVPVQKSVMTNLYSPQTGLERGTIYPLLDLPLGVYGFQFSEKENDSL